MSNTKSPTTNSAKSESIVSLSIGNIFVALGLVGSLATASFFFGQHFASARFDNGKTEMILLNKELASEKRQLEELIDNYRNELLIRDSLINANRLNRPDAFTLGRRVEPISYSDPKSIFDGAILVTAEKRFAGIATVEFKGIAGLSRSRSCCFDTTLIHAEQGMRFHILFEDSSIWDVNVLDIEPYVELEFSRAII